MCVLKMKYMYWRTDNFALFASSANIAKFNDRQIQVFNSKQKQQQEIMSASKGSKIQETLSLKECKRKEQWILSRLTEYYSELCTRR